MLSYTDMILSVMRRVEVYNEIFIAIYKEVEENSCNNVVNRRGKDTYAFCRNNISRFFMEEANFRKNLVFHGDKEASKLLLQGLDAYKEGIYCCLESINDQCEMVDEVKYNRGLRATKMSFELINQACKEACGGIESAHSVHKM